MELRTRDHVPALAALLSATALALVFGAVLGRIPVESLPRAPDAVIAAIPHVNVALSLLAIGGIVGGWRAILRGDVRRHRALMLASVVLFATFLTLYLYRVSLVGPSPFTGPDVVRSYVYFPVLAVHIFLAIVCIPLLFYVLLLAATRPVTEIYETSHRRVGRVAASLWLVSFALGVVVYALLHALY